MTKVELIQAEVAKVPPERLDELYGVVREFASRRPGERGLMERLREVRIEAPADFAENLDLYEAGGGEDVFAEMVPYMVEVEQVDDSREAIHSRVEGE